MYKKYKIIVWLEVIFFFALLELSSRFKGSIFWLGPLFLILFIFGLWWFSGKRLNKRFFTTCISPVAFVFGAILFFIFLVPQITWFRYVYSIFVSALLWLFLDNLVELLFKPNIHRLFNLENLLSHFNLLSVFLLFSSFYTHIFFPSFIFWITLVLVAVISVLLMHHNFWANKIVNPKKIFFILVVSMILAQVYLVLSFMPTGFYVNGIILTVVYYIMSEVSRVYLLDKLTNNFLKNKIIISLMALALIFLTARWS